MHYDAHTRKSLFVNQWRCVGWAQLFLYEPLRHNRNKNITCIVKVKSLMYIMSIRHMSRVSKVSKQELMSLCPSQIKKYRPVLPTEEKFQ